ncbi:hypothetical protein GCM10011339_15230 [Echinicola rosea]|uniref:Lipocalin-like domain-containing protein n=1 Tax=Echinicola rosea TaxID=1807691 RepID=A0ABQ1UVH1_9BACT|nr:hypothetical protein GCM10011339_15230 [Echinicola rosea]
MNVSFSDTTNVGDLHRAAMIGMWQYTGNPSEESDPNKRIKEFELKADSTARVCYLDRIEIGKWHWKEIDLSEGTREFKIYVSGLILEFSRNGKSKVFFGLKLDTIKVDAPMTLEKGKFQKL